MNKQILVETSARHVHLSPKDFESLFGVGASLTLKKHLSQPGQFACEERVTIVGPRKELANVSILGPFRKQTQVEISATDARSLGIAPIVRESGDLKETPGCKIIGPNGEIELKEGVIIAKRHIHATSSDAQVLGLSDKQIVSVKLATPQRPLIFGDVVVRINDSYALAMHIDTDEANAALVGPDTYGEIII